MVDYPIGKVVFGSEAAIRAAYEIFKNQPVDEVRKVDAASYPPTEGSREASAMRGAASPIQAPTRHSDAAKAASTKATTLESEVAVAGAGTFNAGTHPVLTFAPSEKPGWWIRRCDQPEQLDTEVHIANLWTSAQNLVLRSGSPHNYLRMVEHIIALKLGLGVDNVLIKVMSGDPPLFNDSSLPLVKAMEHAKIVETASPAQFVTVKEPVAFGGKRGDFLLMLPATKEDKGLHIDCAIKWNTVIGEQRVQFDVTPETFAYASYARTNCTYKQFILSRTIGRFIAAMRNLGYTKKNILIHGKGGFYTEPRFKVGEKFLEPVWHRATLDLMAALALTGPTRFCGTVVSYRAGHTLDCDAMRALYRNNLLCSI